MVFLLFDVSGASTKFKDRLLPALMFLVFVCCFFIVIYEASKEPYSPFMAEGVFVSVLFAAVNIMGRVHAISRDLRSRTFSPQSLNRKSTDAIFSMGTILCLIRSHSRRSVLVFLLPTGPINRGSIPRRSKQNLGSITSLTRDSGEAQVLTCWTCPRIPMPRLLNAVTEWSPPVPPMSPGFL